MIQKCFQKYWHFVRGIHHHLQVDSPHKGLVMCSLDVSLMLAWTSCWTNSPVGSDLRYFKIHATSHHFYEISCTLSKHQSKLFSRHWCPMLFPDSKVHGANMGPIWGWQDPGGPHVGPMNFAIWVYFHFRGSGQYSELISEGQMSSTSTLVLSIKLSKQNWMKCICYCME